ncbi:hypothetical protein E7X23_25400, partial [Bacteroides fragilis]
MSGQIGCRCTFARIRNGIRDFACAFAYNAFGLTPCLYSLTAALPCKVGRDEYDRTNIENGNTNLKK